MIIMAIMLIITVVMMVTMIVFVITLLIDWPCHRHNLSTHSELNLQSRGGEEKL